MAYKPFPFTEFGGLDHTSAADDSACIDCLNVDFSLPGVIRTREGYGDIGSAAAEFYSYVAGLPASGLYLLAARTSSLELLDASDGSVDGSLALGSAATALTTAAFGTTSNSYHYIGVGSLTVKRLAGTVLSSPTATVDGVAGRAMPIAKHVATQPAGNRLAAANTTTTGGPHAAASSTSHIWFSDQDNAESWDTDNFLALTPGDGEEITAVVPWREYLFVFKESKFFVFYGEQTDSGGDTEFLFRKIEGQGAGTGANIPATAAPDGVYFSNRLGIWKTTGGVPVRVSNEVAGKVGLGAMKEPHNFTTAGGPGVLTCSLAYTRDRIVAHQPGSNTFAVLFLTTGKWSLWQSGTAMNGIAAVRLSNDVLLYSALASGDKQVVTWSGITTDDNGTAITSLYRAGFTDMGVHDEKRIVQWDVWGTGTVDLKTSRDFGSLSSATSLTLGTSPAVDVAVARKAVDGTLFSWQIGASSGHWTVHRIVPRLNAARTPSTKTP